MKILVKELQSVLDIDDDAQIVNWLPMNIGWNEEYAGEESSLNSECWFSVDESVGSKIHSIDFPHFRFTDKDGWSGTTYKRIPFMIEIQDENKEWNSYKVNI